MREELIEWAFILLLGILFIMVEFPLSLILVVILIIIWKIDQKFEISEFLEWLIKGKPYITYEGYHCGCCGCWENKLFSIPTYKSSGKWCDTWGLCSKCNKR